MCLTGSTILPGENKGCMLRYKLAPERSWQRLRSAYTVSVTVSSGASQYLSFGQYLVSSRQPHGSGAPLRWSKSHEPELPVHSHVGRCVSYDASQATTPPSANSLDKSELSMSFAAFVSLRAVKKSKCRFRKVRFSAALPCAAEKFA